MKKKTTSDVLVKMITKMTTKDTLPVIDMKHVDEAIKLIIRLLPNKYGKTSNKDDVGYTIGYRDGHNDTINEVRSILRRRK